MSKENILGTLVVVVLKGQHLIDNHTFYKQDPYAKLSLSGATKQTPPDPKGGQHPVWDAEFRFPISKDASKNNRTLTISVFSEEKKDDSLLGEGSVDITDTLKTGEFDDWVPLSLKGTQRGDVYLEMTFFAAGPAPLTRRATKFTSPSERLGRPQQPIVTQQQQQQPYRVTSQPPSSPLPPQGQQGPRINTQDVSRQRPPRGQQARLPGAWPGPSAQHQQLPPEPEPKQEFVPSILRPGGPSRSGNTSPNAHPAHQNTPPLPGSSASQSRFSSSSPSLEAQPSHAPRVSSYSGQGGPGQGGYVPGSNGYLATQPSPEIPHVHHNLPSQPSPQQRQQTQHPASHPAPYASPYPPNNHSAGQTPVAHHASTQPVPAYVATQSPAPSAFSYVASPGPAPPAHSHIASSGHVPPAQQHAATLSPAPPIHHHATSISAAPPSPPPHSYPSGPPSRPSAAHSSAPQSYSASPVPYTSPYSAPTSPNPQAQPYVSPLGPVLSHPAQPHPAQSRLTPPSSPPHTQSYFQPPNAIFPLPTSPPPGPSYGHSYEPAPALSFPVPQSTPDYFGTRRPLSPQPPAPYAAPGVETDLPDPYLLERYKTPLPLPPGSNRAQHTQPKPHAPAPAVPAAAAAAAPSRQQDESERAAREVQRRYEENARARREQEVRDAELARTLDLELNMDGGEPGRPALPPRRAQAVGGQRSGMPGAW